MTSMQLLPVVVIQYAKYEIHHLELDQLTNNTGLLFGLCLQKKKSCSLVSSESGKTIKSILNNFFSSFVMKIQWEMVMRSK
jgi:hypothetical protein